MEQSAEEHISPTKVRKQSTPRKECLKREKEIIKLSAQGLTSETISQIVGVAPRTVRKYRTSATGVIKELKEELKQIDKFVIKKSDYLTAIELKTLRSLASGSKLEEANAKDLSAIYNKIHSANRLEQGKSTSNSSVSFTVNKVDLNAVKR